MGWAKLDDGWATHPKILKAGLEAAGLDAKAFAHCAKYETDGFVSDADVVMLAAGARSPHKLAQRLVEVGRWARDNERKGYEVHDYLKYNPSRQEAETKRKADRVRKDSERKPPGQTAESTPSPGGNPAESEGNPSGPPVRGHAPQPRAQNPTRTRGVKNTNPSVPTDSLGANGTGVGVEKDLEPSSTPTEVSTQTGKLMGRLASICTATNRGLVNTESAQVVSHALRFVDWKLIDEAIGSYAASGNPPTLPRALVPAIQSRAQQVGIKVPEWKP